MKRRRATKSETDRVIKQMGQLLQKPPVFDDERYTKDDLIPTGSVLLNLACSDNPLGGYGKGRIITMPGGSASGKTLLNLTMFAEMAKLKRFRDYLFIYDDVEEALGFDLIRLFGKRMAHRLIPPKTRGDESVHSDSIEDFQDNIVYYSKQLDQPFVYVLDSLDAITSRSEIDRMYRQAILSAKTEGQVQEIKGAYKTEKAKILGELLRVIKSELKRTGSLLIIIQQERQKIGMSFGRATTTSGGNAPEFYSSHRIWLTKLKSILCNDRKIGRRIKAEVTKNKLTGNERTVEFDVYNKYGVDDVGSCVDFLVKEGYWERKGNSIDSPNFEIKGTRAKIIENIEDAGREKELFSLVGDVWKQIEDSLNLDRKPRFR